jgi:hypothetical protein
VQYAYLPRTNGHPVWAPLYTFRAAYGARDLTCVEMTKIVKTMSNSTAAMARFLRLHHGNITAPACDAACVASWGCLLGTVTSTDYATCEQTSKSSSGGLSQTGRVLLPIFMMVILFLLSVGWWGYRRRRNKAPIYAEMDNPDD